MTTNYQLRKQLFDKQDLGEHARDTQNALEAIARVISKTVEQYYTEPMTLSSPITGTEPESIRLARIISIVTPEQPVACGSLVHYVWKPQLNGCVVTSIDGLTPSTAIKYRMTFDFKFTAKGST